MAKSLAQCASRNKYTLKDLYSWIANGSISSRDRDCSTSAISRYAPFFARKWQKQLHSVLPHATVAFWEQVMTMVRSLKKAHFKATAGVQMLMTKMSWQDYEDQTLDIAMFFIETWLPSCLEYAFDYTTLGDYAVFSFRLAFNRVLMYWDVCLQHGIADLFDADMNQIRRDNTPIMRAVIAYTKWQKTPHIEPLHWLRQRNYISPRTTTATKDMYLDVWRRLSYCFANVPHNMRCSYTGRLNHLGGYTTPNEVNAANTVLDECYTLL